MTDQRLVTPAPAPLEVYAHLFDDLFAKLNQRNGFRRYLEGLRLSTERHKSLTGLANTEPVVGAQHRRAQALQWFLSESTRVRTCSPGPASSTLAFGSADRSDHGGRARH